MEDIARPQTVTQPPNEQTALAIEVVESMARVADIVRERIGAALLEANVNETRLIVMRNIAARGDAGCSQAELAVVLRQAESSVCTLIERMKKDGLVHRFRSKQDRRKSFLMLTSDGHDQLQDALDKYFVAARELHTIWGAEQSSALRDLLDNLLFALERPASDKATEAATGTSDDTSAAIGTISDTPFRAKAA